MKQFRSILVSVVFLAALPLFAETYTVDKVHSNVEFKVHHMIGTVVGKFTDFTGTVNADRANPTAATVEFTIQAGSVDTATPDRDKHLRSADFFDVEKFPTIVFRSTKVAKTGTKDVYDVTGDLTMHGITKRITMPVTFLGFQKDPWGNMRAGFEMETTLNRKDYGINWNKTLDEGGVLLQDDIRVTINLEAVQKK